MNILLVRKYPSKHLIKKPSNQQQIIEQAKFTDSPFGKAFEKQIKIIEDQGEKQVEVLKDLKSHKKQTANNYEDNSLISKEWKTCKNIYNNSLNKIIELSEKIDDSNLVFSIVSTGRKTDFSKNDDPLTFLSKVKKR